MKKILISPFGNEVLEVTNQRAYERAKEQGFTEEIAPISPPKPVKKGGKKNGKNQTDTARNR